MAFSQTYKEGLFVELQKIQVLEPQKANLWYKELSDILNSKGVKLIKLFAGKKIARILEIANQLVGLLTLIQAIGGWENFKIIIIKLIEIGGIEETIQKLEPQTKEKKK